VRAGTYVNDLFMILQWRLSRLARIRSELFDRAGDLTRAKEDLAFAEALDDRNASLKRILEGMTRLRENTMRQMTPREGLQFALVRADFSLARRYAEPILDADPEDVDANFGMGMSYLMEEQYGRAEEYLKRALGRKPKEPAIWNNIAVIQYRQGRLEEAKANAQKALSLLPDSAEVKDTLAKIETAMKEKAAKGGTQKE
jgi:tetratricopeptide (TPR) repeat protein